MSDLDQRLDVVEEIMEDLNRGYVHENVGLVNTDKAALKRHRREREVEKRISALEADAKNIQERLAKLEKFVYGNA